MMSLEQINRMSREAAEEAAAENKVPFMVEEEEDIKVWKKLWEIGRLQLPFPDLGSYIPKGWKRVESHFVDSSGLGTVGELALTIGQFLQILVPGYGYAITEVGQFQVYIGQFKKIGKGKKNV